MARSAARLGALLCHSRDAVRGAGWPVMPCNCASGRPAKVSKGITPTLMPGTAQAISVITSRQLRELSATRCKSPGGGVPRPLEA